MTARALVRSEESARPQVVELAVLASAASLVEPALLRRLRLELAPALDTGAEADLWFSPLVQLATSSAISLRPDVLPVLRGRLAEPGRRTLAEAAHRIVQDAHRTHSSLRRLEDDVVWASIIGDETAVEGAMRRVVATIRDDAIATPDVLRWFGQAVRRLPSMVTEVPSGRQLLTALALHLDRRVPPGVIGAATLPDGTGLAPTSLPTIELSLTMSPGSLQLLPLTPGEAQIEAPATDPPVLEVSWERDDGQQVSQVVNASPGQRIPLDGGHGDVELRTLAGTRYRVRRDNRPQVVIGLPALGRSVEYGVPEAEQRAVDDVQARIEALGTALPDIAVHLLTGIRDLSGRPDILLLPPSYSEDVSADIIGPFQRAMLRGGDRGLDAGSRWLEALAESRIIVPFDAPPDALEDAARAAAEHPGLLYQARPDVLTRLLQGLALPFHTRRLVPSIDQNSFLRMAFGTENAERARYEHVRLMAEWLFGGPVREYLSGLLNPTWPSPTLAEPLHFAGSADPEQASPGRSIELLDSGDLFKAVDAGLPPGDLRRRLALRRNDDGSVEGNTLALVEAWQGDPTQREAIRQALTELNTWQQLNRTELRFETFAGYLRWYIGAWAGSVRTLARAAGGETVVVRCTASIDEDDVEAAGLLIAPARLELALDLSSSTAPDGGESEVTFDVRLSDLEHVINTLAMPLVDAIDTLERAERTARRTVETEGVTLTGVVPSTGRDRTHLAWAPSGTRLAASGGDGVTVWDALIGRVRAPRLDGGVGGVVWESDTVLLTGTRHGSVIRHDLAAVTMQETRVPVEGSIVALALLPRAGRLVNRTVVYADEAGQVLLADSQFPDKVRASLNGPTPTVLRALPDGTGMVSGDRDGALTLWQPEHHERITVPRVLPREVTALDVGRLRDGRMVIACADAEGLFGLFLPNLAPLPEARGVVAGQTLAWSPLGGDLAVANRRGELILGDPLTRLDVLSFPVRDKPAVALAWSPDAHFLAIGWADGTVQIVPVPTAADPSAQR